MNALVIPIMINYDRQQGFLPFTLVLGTLIDKSWLIYLALYIGEERNRKEEKEKNMGCFLYLINWLTQTEKRYISHLEEFFFQCSDTYIINYEK